MTGTFYITTAIDYANGNPHLGHAYEKVLADVLARHRRRCGDRVYFLTGTDEHGQKVQQSAEALGQSPQQFCDANSARFRELCTLLGLSNDDFIRTTETRHQTVVRQILQKLADQGDIYKAEYTGFYSTRAEQFLTEREQVNGRWPEEFGDVVELTEQNYFFRLSKYQDWLKDFIESHPDWVFPAFRTRELLSVLEDPIPDLCISRPKSRLSWGIELPFDPDHVTYVWFDALTNYISAIRYGTDLFDQWWPATHVIGKDILRPPHGIYWPIMLRAIGVEPPRKLIVHGWWTLDQAKMSKSTGKVIDPLHLIETYGPDAFRYFVIREMALGQDADFSLDQFRSRYATDLANAVGNLLNRTVNMVQRYCGGKVPTPHPELAQPVDLDLQTTVLGACAAWCAGADRLQLHVALHDLWKGFQRANQFVEENAPWKLAKDQNQRPRLEHVLHQLVAALDVLSDTLQPVMPRISAQARAQLGLPEIPVDAPYPKRWPENLAGIQIAKPVLLFPRLEESTPK